MTGCRGCFRVEVSAAGQFSLPGDVAAKGLQRFTLSLGDGESVVLTPAPDGAVAAENGIVTLPAAWRRFAGTGVLAGFGTAFELWSADGYRRATGS